VKLTSWLSYDALSDALRRYDAEVDVELGHHARRWGYGFCYVYTARLAAECPFAPVDHGEDYALVLAAAASGHTAIGYADEAQTAVCAHVTHGLNTSGVRAAATACAADARFARPPASELLEAARRRTHELRALTRADGPPPVVS
jgi:hypothetical protein